MRAAVERAATAEQRLTVVTASFDQTTIAPLPARYNLRVEARSGDRVADVGDALWREGEEPLLNSVGKDQGY